MGAVMLILERKLVADFQARIGPHQAGPHGLFQPIADFLKLIQKAVRREGGQAWTRFVRSSMLETDFFIAFSTLALLPLTYSFVFSGVEIATFLVIVVFLSGSWIGLLSSLFRVHLGIGAAHSCQDPSGMD